MSSENMNNINTVDNDEETEMERIAIKEHEGEEEFIQFLTGIDNQKAAMGETVQFKSIIIAKPDVYVEWYFNGVFISGGDENFVVSSKGNHYMLTIKKMSAATVGTVEQIARHEVGVASTEVKLELKD